MNQLKHCKLFASMIMEGNKMITKIKTIMNASNVDKSIHNYVLALGNMIITYTELETLLSDDYFKTKSFDELKKQIKEDVFQAKRWISK